MAERVDGGRDGDDSLVKVYREYIGSVYSIYIHEGV